MLTGNQTHLSSWTEAVSWHKDQLRQKTTDSSSKSEFKDMFKEVLPSVELEVGIRCGCWD